MSPHYQTYHLSVLDLAKRSILVLAMIILFIVSLNGYNDDNIYRGEAVVSCNRITTGLQVLYDFNEGSGSTVNDVSGVGTALNLTIANTANTTWVTGGLNINSETILESATAATKVNNAVISSNEITLEAWVKPANNTQGGPARIMTISSGAYDRNCTLGQEATDYAVRFKTTTTGNNGYPTLVESPLSTVNLQHVVYTWDGNTGTEKIYIDGTEEYSGTRSGNTSTWVTSYKLAIANEISTSRAWLGQINLAAIYNQALTSAEVLTNYNEGSECSNNNGGGNSSSCGSRITNDLEVLYDFNEGSGSIVNDISGVGAPLNLTIANTSNTTWVSGGLNINSETILESATSASKVSNAIINSNEITMEAWVKPTNTTQGGPARIMTISSDSQNRNNTLGQEGAAYAVRHKTTTTGNNGYPTLTESPLFISQLQHVVYTWNGSTGVEKIYIDGNEEYSGTRTGNTSTWVASYKLAIGNEINASRAWLGQINLAAIYSKALTFGEVQTNYLEGPECQGPPGLASTCDAGITIDHYGAGCDNGSVSVNVPNLSNVNKTTLEVVYKGCYPGTSVTVSSSIGNITLNEIVVAGGSSSVYIYKAEISGGATNLSSTAACGSCSSGNGLQSLVVYAERNTNTNSGYSTLFTEQSGYCSIVTLTLPIPTSTAPRDVDVILPFSELTDDGRYLTVTATSNTGNVSASETIYGPDLSLGSCCFDFVELTLINVPANSTYITIDIITDTANHPTGSSCGQSWVVSGTIYSEIECSCIDVTANAGSGIILCTGNSNYGEALNGSATGGTSPLSYSWTPTTGLSNPNIAQPFASPASTTTYTLTVTGDDGCEDTDQVVVTVYNNYDDPGIISGDEGSCGSFDPSTITSTSGPTGGNGGSTIYIWQSRVYNCATDSWTAWSNISGATSATYDPTTITQTTEYRRLARRSSCLTWVISNTVIKDVVQNYTDAGSISGAESNCGSYDPTPLTNSADPSGGCGGDMLHLWRMREYNCTTEAWEAWVTISGATGSEYDPTTITVTTQFRRQSRRIAGCTPGWVYATPVTKTVVENITDVGAVGSPENVCGGYDPDAIVISTLPSGGCGADIEYRWYERTQDCATGTWTTWVLQTNSNTSTWDPGPITETTHYAYHARRGDCAWVPGPGVIKTVTENFTDAGVISGDETMCGSFDPTEIISTSDPSGGCGTFWGIWQKRELDCSTNLFGAWANITGTTNLMYYDPPTITSTTEYRRVYTRTGCNPTYVITNTVTKEVLVHYTDGGTIGSDETMCGGYDPEEITNISSPIGGCGGTQNIRWYMWERDCNTGSWITPATLISGADGLSYDPPAITVSTRYRRYARRGTECTGTNGTWMVSNMIYKYVNEDIADPGTISSDQENCGAFDPSIISGTVTNGGCQVQIPQYIWQFRLGTSGTFTNIAGANGSDYDPGPITETTQYRRAVSYDPCPWTHSNIVTMSVYDNFVASASNNGPLTCSLTSVTATALPAGLSYSWTGGGTAQTASYNTPGTYTVTVTDDNGCTSTASTIITENITTPLAEFTIPAQSCEDDIVTFTASDAGVGATYAWAFGDFSTPATATGIGPHDVVYSGFPAINSTQTSSVNLVVTASNGCTDNQTSNVNIRPTPEVEITSINPSCDTDNGQLIFDITIGNNNGVSVSIDGGQSFSGTGLSGAGIYTVSNLQPGIYHTIIQYGSTECPTDLGTFYLEQEPTPEITLSDEIICEGESVTLDPDVCERYPNVTAQRPLADNTGWKNSYMDGSQSGLTGDGTLCFTLDEFTDSSPQIIGLNDNPNASVSFGDIDYAIYVYIRDDIPQYLMQIRENGTSMGNPYNSTSSYEGSTFCIRRTGTTVEYLMDDVVMYTSTVSSTGTLYYDHSFHSGGGVWTDGYSKFTDISLCAKASDLDMSYSWSTGATTSTITTSVAGNNTVTVTDYNGCTSTATSVITIDNIDESATNNGPITCDQTIVTLTALPVGMSYLWSGGGTGQTKNITTPGTYHVTITSLSGCTDVATTIVTEDTQEPTANAGDDIDICSSFDIVTLGTSPIAGMSYQWSISGSNISGETNSTIDVSPDNTTTYTVTVIADNGCSDTDQVIVTVASSPSATATGENVCAGETATILGTTSGGLGTETYLWQYSAGGSVWTDISGATNINYTTTALSADTYYRLQVSYSGTGCGILYSNPTLVEVDIESMAVSIMAEPESICINESTTLSINESIATGGLLDYSNWTVGTGSIGQFNVNGSANENHRINGTDPWGNNTVVWEARPDATSNADGGWNSARVDIDHTKLYRFSVWVNRKVLGDDGRFYLGTRGYGSTNGVKRRSNGSTLENAYFYYSNPPTSMPEDEWMLVVGHVYPSTDNGTSNHNDSGLYTTSNGSIGNIYNDYQWLSGTTESLHRTYLYYTTDTDVRQQWVYPRVDLIDGTEPSIDDLLNGFDINGGLGTGADWEWYSGSCGGTPIGSGNSITVNPTATTTYYVRGEGDCGNSDCQSITVTVNNPPAATATNDGPLTCGNTSVTLTATPAGANYLWSNGNTNQSQDVTTSGLFSVTVTDSNGCTNTAQTTIEENTTPTPIYCQRYRLKENDIWGPWINFDGNCTIEFCEGDGLTDFQFDGGPDNNTGWVWTDEDGNVDSETDEVVLFSNIGTDDAGTYMGVLTNENGCVSEISFEVVVNENPMADAGDDKNICLGFGTILNATGGSEYLWNDPSGSTSSSIIVNPQVTTTYIVTVTDDNACISTDEITVTVDSITNMMVTVSDSLSCGQSTVQLEASPTGLDYEWSGPSGFTSDISNPTASEAGTYSVTITDPSTSCSKSSTIDVILKSNIVINDINMDCGDNDIHVDYTAQGTSTQGWVGLYEIGAPDSQFIIWQWLPNMPGSGTITFQNHNLNSGTFEARIFNGTAYEICATTSFDYAPLMSIDAGIDHLICSGNNANIDLTINDGTAPFTITWSGPNGYNSDLEDIAVSEAGTYTVTVTDDNDCSDTDEVIITITNVNTTIILPTSNCTDLSSLFEAEETTDATYAWDFSGGTTTDGDNDDRIEEVMWSETYLDTTVSVSLTVTTINGCVSTATESVTIYALPEDDIQGDMAVSENESGVVYEGPDADTYEWSILSGDAQIIGPTNGQTCIVDYLSNDATLQLIVTNEVGCPDTLYQEVRTLPLSICSYYDNFDTPSYNNSSGSQDWSNNSWIEYNDNNSATTGKVRINGRRLRMTNNSGEPTVYIEREVSLIQLDNPHIFFDFRQSRGIEAGDIFEVQIYDGTTWTTIYSLDGVKPAGFYPDIDITAYASANTKIRFALTGGYTGWNERIRIDDVFIYGECNLCAFELVGLINENTCEGQCDGTIFINPDYPVTGDFNLSYDYNGTTYNLGPYTNGDTVFVSGLCAGTYSNIIISRVDNQCSEAWPQSLTIGETGAEWEHVTHTDDVDNCDGICNGSFTVDANHGLTGEFTISYTFEGIVTTLGPYDFAGDILIDDLCPGTYSDITITGTETGCSDVWPDDIEIVIERPDATVVTYEDDHCQEEEGSTILQVSGGNTPYSITWHSEDGTITGSTTLNHSGQVEIEDLVGGHTYCITVTDSNGCTND